MVADMILADIVVSTALNQQNTASRTKIAIHIFCQLQLLLRQILNTYELATQIVLSVSMCKVTHFPLLGRLVAITGTDALMCCT